MRQTMFSLLAAQSGLVALVPVARWYRAGNVVDTPVKPFVVLRWIAPVVGNARGTFAKQLRLEVHAARGSYKPCEDWLAIADPTLSSAVNVTGVDGRITQCDFLGRSGDQEDATYKTNLMFSSWQVIGEEW